MSYYSLTRHFHAHLDHHYHCFKLRFWAALSISSVFFWKRQTAEQSLIHPRPPQVWGKLSWQINFCPSVSLCVGCKYCHGHRALQGKKKRSSALSFECASWSIETAWYFTAGDGCCSLGSLWMNCKLFIDAIFCGTVSLYLLI